MIGLKKWQQLIEKNRIRYDCNCINTIENKKWVRPESNYQIQKPVDQIFIKKSLMEYFIQVHRIFYNHCGQLRSGESSTGNQSPLIFILGKKNKYIDTSALVNDNGGCGILPGIPSDQFNEALYEIMKCDAMPAGIARIGTFDKIPPRYSINTGDKHEYIGKAFQQFARQLKNIDFCLLSIGCWNINAYVARKENGFNFVPCDLVRQTRKKKVNDQLGTN